MVEPNNKQQMQTPTPSTQEDQGSKSRRGSRSSSGIPSSRSSQERSEEVELTLMLDTTTENLEAEVNSIIFM